ncbi:TATE DNA Transposon [Leptomonas pyrrhocoris]|uniref:TATE DNA Transposon n=1 Tax=Leptomonas pyrrhocoris TaxID=157538 RepID=A0A0M9FQ55_LEPPY|nr:TATE DNA Transposon [Leptomonas pyrrhocoris]KPA73800.1 TATE DNA Transposon [Leptomonas pyrrhocoris]|eukprot:XP_015652239.1 TATE DNA Transposon [Leptomonas pyrrhocoris]
MGGGTAPTAASATADVPRAFRKEVWGGDLREGKTSNVELDVIYARYLPALRIVPSDTMVYLAPERVKTLVEKVRRQGVLYFPIFVMKHWIAGVLTAQPAKGGSKRESEVVLTTYDSAPSPVVEEKLRSVFARVWPGLRMVKGQCPRQERYSDDCGLYMTANFFRHHLQARLVDRRDLPRCLRRLLYAAKKHNPPVEYFHEKMRKVLTSHPVSRCDRFYDEIERAPWKRETRSWAQRVAGPAVHTGGAAPRKAPARRQAVRRTASAAAPAARRARAEFAAHHHGRALYLFHGARAIAS